MFIVFDSNAETKCVQYWRKIWFEKHIFTYSSQTLLVMKHIVAILVSVVAVLLSFCAPSAPQTESASLQSTALAAGNDAISDPMKDAGVDFVCFGTEPFWGISIDFEKQILFSIAGGDTAIVPAVMGSRDAEGNTVYSAKTEKHQLRVLIRRAECSDGMSDGTYAFTVKAEVDGEIYEGCGRSITPGLGTVWSLKTIGGALPGAGAFPAGRFPVFTVNMLENRWGGTDGCNVTNGKVVLSGDQLKIEPGISTLMKCPGEGSDAYMKALFNVTKYRIDGEELILMTGDKEVLRFDM
jgi:uncharacterized membrane protein